MKEQEEISKKLEIELQNISVIKPVKKTRKREQIIKSEDDVILSSLADEVNILTFSILSHFSNTYIALLSMYLQPM